jgi:hypothetical protein
MFKFDKPKQSFFLLFIFLVSSGFNINPSTAKCTLYGEGNIVAAWQSKDERGQDIIQAAVGSAFTKPQDWTLTTLSDSFYAIENQQPTFSSNSSGDIVVLWKYIDSDSKASIAAATLPRDTMNWKVSTLSTIEEPIQLNNQIAEVNEEGHALVLWSISDPITEKDNTLISETLLGVEDDWSPPLVILEKTCTTN